jgi:Uncharacterised protein family (UPF0261)
VLPLHGVQAWDRPGQPLHDPHGLAAFIDETRQRCAGRVTVHELAAHINDDAFCECVLQIFDDWLATGRIHGPTPGSTPGSDGAIGANGALNLSERVC